MFVEELTEEGIFRAYEKLMSNEKFTNPDFAISILYNQLTDLAKSNYCANKPKSDSKKLLSKWKKIAQRILDAYPKDISFTETRAHSHTKSTSLSSTLFYNCEDFNIDRITDNSTHVSVENLETFNCNASPILPKRTTNAFMNNDSTAESGVNLATDSFTSDTYHRTRHTPYIFNNFGEWVDFDEKWMIDDLIISDELKVLYEQSKKCATNGDISDLRILVLHFIFPFLPDKSESTTKYLGTHGHNIIQNDLKLILNNDIPEISDDLIRWVNFLSLKKYESWFEMKDACTDILLEAKESGDETNKLAASIIFGWFCRLKPSPSHNNHNIIEDTFVHCHLDVVLNEIFSSDPIFEQEWANGYLESCKKENELIFKPDWAAFVRPWYTRFDIGVCEVKPPGKKNVGVYSDYVKMGLEMKNMLNCLVKEGVDDAQVFGILVVGFKVETYLMDLEYPPIYRLIQLGNAQLPNTISSFTLFIPVFKIIMQLKNMASVIGYKLDKLQTLSTKGKRKLSNSWLNDHYPTCTKQKK